MNGNGRPHVSEKKKQMINTLLNKDSRVSLKFAATSIGLPHTMTWNFLMRELKLHTSHTIIKCINKPMIWTSKIRFVLQDVVKVDSDIIQISLNDWNFLISVHLCSLDLSTSQTVSYGLRTSKKRFRNGKQRTSALFWCAVSKKLIGTYIFGNNNGAWEPYKNLLRHFAIPKLWKYPEITIFNRRMLLLASSLLYISILTKRTTAIGCRELSPIHALFTHRNFRLVTILWGYLKKIVYSEPPNIIPELDTTFT